MAVIHFSERAKCSPPAHYGAYHKLFAVWGNGDPDTGYALFYAVTMRLVHARSKHPVFARNADHALTVVGSEFDELKNAVARESAQRHFDKALDVAVTALRFAGKEF